jgi:hypothetical protein
MKSVVRTASGMAMACVFAVTVAAQSGSTADPQDAGQGTSTTTQQPSTTGTSGEYGAEQRDQDRDRSQTEARSQTGQITLTGCLQGSQGNWMLTQAAMAGGAMSGAGHTAGTQHGETGAQADATAGQTGATAGVGQSETAGTAGTAGMHAQTKSYRLQAESAHNDDLRNKVGKRVEIRGSFVGASSSYGQAGQAGQAVSRVSTVRRARAARVEHDRRPGGADDRHDDGDDGWRGPDGGLGLGRRCAAAGEGRVGP